MAIILEFGLNGNYYAMDIHLTREIVEALPLTPIPRTPGYIAGMTNIRGEITTIVAIDELIGTKRSDRMVESEKFIIFMPTATKGENIGMMVDEVYTVLEVPENEIERNENAKIKEHASFIKGVIRIRNASEEGKRASVSQRLVLYLDIEKLITHLFEMASR